MPARIIVIDDEVYSRKMICSVLSRTGFEITSEGGDFEAAVSKFTQYKPDLLILDLLLPGKSGIEAMKEILNANKRAKILVLSEIYAQSTLFQCIKAGASGFIRKPVKAQAELLPDKHLAKSENPFRAILNTLLGMIAITGFYLFPMYLTGHWYLASFLCLIGALLCSGALYFTWYRYLPAQPVLIND